MSLQPAPRWLPPAGSFPNHQECKCGQVVVEPIFVHAHEDHSLIKGYATRTNSAWKTSSHHGGSSSSAYPPVRRSSMLLATSSQTTAKSRSSCLPKLFSASSASCRYIAASVRR